MEAEVIILTNLRKLPLSWIQIQSCLDTIGLDWLLYTNYFNSHEHQAVAAELGRYREVTLRRNLMFVLLPQGDLPEKQTTFAFPQFNGEILAINKVISSTGHFSGFWNIRINRTKLFRDELFRRFLYPPELAEIETLTNLYLVTTHGASSFVHI